MAGVFSDSRQHVSVVLRCGRVFALSRGWDLGNQYPGCVGICDREFRMVDRDRPRRHFHFGHSVAAISEMAYDDQSLYGGDDFVRSNLCRAISTPSSWTALDLLFSHPLPGHHGFVAAISESADMGHFRSQHLLHGISDFLVCRTDA